MKFTVSANVLFQKASLVRRVLSGSRLQHKALILEATEDWFSMYAQSEGMFTEAIIPEAKVLEPGRVEIGLDSLNFSEFLGVRLLTFEQEQSRLYFDKTNEKFINVAEVEPKFIVRPPAPEVWHSFSDDQRVVFDVLYAADDKNVKTNNVFIHGPIIATGSPHAFSGYKHSAPLTEEPLTIPIEAFQVLPQEPFDMGFIGKRIWFRTLGETFFVAAMQVDYTNPVVTQLGYYENLGPDFFEIEQWDARQMLGYTHALSASSATEKDGRGRLVSEGGIITMHPIGNELGRGAYDPLVCKSWHGEWSAGVSTSLMRDALAHVDSNTFKVYKIENAFVVVGEKTRHLVAEAHLPDA